MQIRIDCTDIPDLRVKLQDMLRDLNPPVTYSNTPAPVAPIVNTPPGIAAMLIEPKKRGPKPKVKEPVQTDIEEVTSAPAVKQPTYDEVIHALKEYSKMKNSKGEPNGVVAGERGKETGVRGLLMRNFGVEQTKAIKPEDFARVIELANSNWQPAA